MPRRAALLSGILGLIVTTSVATTAGTAGAVTAVPPTLTARPHSVMVDTDTTVKGRNFAPGSAVVLRECSSTSWLVSASPCNTDNTVTVVAGRKGAFKTPFEVELCPGGTRWRYPTSEKCSIGVSEPSGIDTVSLSPSAKLLVTYP